MINLGKSFSKALAEHGSTHLWLAEGMDITAPSLSRIKKSNRISIALLEKAAKRLGCKASELIALGET